MTHAIAVTLAAKEPRQYYLFEADGHLTKPELIQEYRPLERDETALAEYIKTSFGINRQGVLAIHFLSFEKRKHEIDTGVVEGIMEVLLGGAWQILRKGEGLRFDADQPHGYRNVTSETVCFHNIIHYPRDNS